MLLLRDFGIKDKVRSVKSLYGVPGMEPEDEQKFREIVEKYEMKATIIEEYPAWLIDKMRNNIMNILHNMITASYTQLRAHETGRKLVCRFLL